MVLIATTNAVLVRKDIHPALIDLLAHAIMEVHGNPGIFQQAGEFPKLPDPEYRVAEGARDFYKNGPTVLNRYLPFWMTNYAQRILAVLVTVIAIVVPVFSYAPKLYKWLVELRLNAMYRRLRRIEASLHKDNTLLEVPALEAELASVDRAIHMLAVPMKHSDLYFTIRSNAELVRARLRSCRAKLLSQTTKAA